MSVREKDVLVEGYWRLKQLWAADPASTATAVEQLFAREFGGDFEHLTVDVSSRQFTSNLALSHQIVERIAPEIDPKSLRFYSVVIGEKPAAAVEQFASNRKSLAESAVRSAGLPPAYTSRLSWLVDSVEEEYPSTDYPSSISIAAFAHCIRVLAPVIRPSISLMPDGGIWAQWTDAARMSAALLARRDGSLAFGAVMPGVGLRPTHINYSGGLEVVQRIIADPSLSWIHGR